MKQKNKKPAPQLQQQQQQQHPQQQQQQLLDLPVSQPWQQPLPISSYFTLEPPPAVQQLPSSAAPSYSQGFASLRPVSPSSQLFQAPPSITTTSPQPTAHLSPRTTPATPNLYADPRIVSPRGSTLQGQYGGSSSSFAASSSTAAMGLTSPGRTVSGGLAARIQAAELAAAGTFDPASWAAAAAEAVRADKEAAAAAARQAKQQEDAQRRLQQQQAAAAALAAGRVSSAVGSRQPSESGYAGSTMSAAHTPRDWQQQQQQLQLSGTGWLTPAGSTTSSPAAASSASAAASAAAALAAATAGYPRSVSPFKDPAQIAAEYVELQRQQQQAGFSRSPSAMSGVHLSPRMQGYEGMRSSSLREQYTSSGTSTMLQQQSQSLTLMSQQAPMTWQDLGFSPDTIRSPSNVHPQLAPIRTVPLAQPEAVQPGPARSLAVPGHVQDAMQHPGQYNALSLSPVQQYGGLPGQQQYQLGISQQAMQAEMQHVAAAAAAAAGSPGRSPERYSRSSSPAAAAASSTVTAAESTQTSGSRRPLAAAKHSSAAAATPAARNSSKRTGCSYFKQHRVLCVLIPLLVVAAAAVAIGLGVGLSRQGQKQEAAAAAAAAVPDRLHFVITAAIPTSEPAVSCAKWFGSDKSLDTYRAVLISSYAAALSTPPADFDISSVECGGAMMTHPTDLSPPARHLLAAAATERNQQQSKPSKSSSTTDVVTAFSVPNPSEETERNRIITAVEARSEDLLKINLNKFFAEPITIRSAVNVESGSAARSVVPAASPARPDVSRPTTPPSPPAAAAAATAEDSPKKAATPPAAAAPSPPQRVAVPAPAVPAGVLELLPSQDTQPQRGGEQQNPPLYEPYNRQTSNKPPIASPSSSRSNTLDNTIPNCSTSPTIGNSVIDNAGNLWGWENWRSCVFRGYTSVQPERVGSAWEQAPACTTTPDNMNSVLDNNGMQWGWENSRSCAFRPDGWVLWAQQPQPTWDAAPTCAFSPDSSNSVSDSNGKLWGWQNSQSCAFRGRFTGSAQQGAVKWESAPTCGFAPTLVNSVTAVDGRLWGWQDGRSCAFRPAEN